LKKFLGSNGAIIQQIYEMYGILLKDEFIAKYKKLDREMKEKRRK
jgi:hypothetical protein